MLISNWPRKLKFSQFLQAGKTCQLLLTFLTKFTRWSRSTANFYTLVGQNLTGEFMRKIYAASWNLFILTAEADRVLCQLVMWGHYQKGGRGFSGVFWQVHILYIGHSQNVQLTAVKQDSHWPVSHGDIAGSCVSSSRWRDLFGSCRWPVNCFTWSRSMFNLILYS